MSADTSSYHNNHNRMTQPSSSMTVNNHQEVGNSDNTVLLNQMSISQMRALHSKALREAEAKQTELRLVLSSRYRELVGSSDEVLAMKDMAEELYRTMEILPDSMRILMAISDQVVPVPEDLKVTKGRFGRLNNLVQEKDRVWSVDLLKHQLSTLPQIVHRALDKENPHMAAVALVRLFAYMKSRTHQVPSSKQNQYPLVQLLGRYDPPTTYPKQLTSPPLLSIDNVTAENLLLLDAQIRMVYLHVQTIPIQIMKLAKTVLLRQAPSDEQPSRGALSALALLDVKGNSDKVNLGSRLLDTYYDSKAKLLHSLLEELRHISNIAQEQSSYLKSSRRISTMASQCESIMSKIVTVIQLDVIYHSYQIFCDSEHDRNLPELDPHAVKQKCSQFLATHIPLLRSQIRNVLVSSVSVDASMLGELRRSLYETTTHPANISKEAWDEAVDGMVDARLVSPATYGAASAGSESIPSSPFESNVSASNSTLSNSSDTNLISKNATNSSPKFSLWSALFSTTFSSLVHDLLSSSFHSVHSSTISTLLQSLSRAPRRPARSNTVQYSHLSSSITDTNAFESNTIFTSSSLALSSANLLLRPHEVHRNTLLIASQLDKSLEKLDQDAHHLLVHAEEREESERRLRQSLYVQTCEIMGRLLSEIRRMVMTVPRDEDDEDNDEDGEDDATKEIIVGRLCHLLQCKQLKSLQLLLDPNNAPSSTSLTSSSSSSEKVSSNDNLDWNPGMEKNMDSVAVPTRTDDPARGRITLEELQSAFDIADDDDDGIISFTEAVEAMGGAFSGTPFHGAEMVRSTLFLTSTSSEDTNTLQNVTLFELGLLSAKGLRHDIEGSASAMGLIQSCLGMIVQRCFQNWARIVISPLKFSLQMAVEKQWMQGTEIIEEEWHRIYNLEYPQDSEVKKMPSSISSHILAFLLSLSCEMNSAVCPADSIPSSINPSSKVLTLVEIVRNALLQQSLDSFGNVFEKKVLPPQDDFEEPKDIDLTTSCTLQLLADVRFIQYCYFGNKKEHEDEDDECNHLKEKLGQVEGVLLSSLGDDVKENILSTSTTPKHATMESSQLLFTNLFGKQPSVVPNEASLDSSNNPMGLSTSGSKESSILLLNPLESSRRFVLLPIPSEKQINDLELRSTLTNNQDTELEDESKEDTSGVGKGFGFFSSYLKKK